MTNDQSETVTISKMFPSTTANGFGVSGGTFANPDGRRILQLSVSVGGQPTMLDLAEGDTFTFDDGTWTVTKIEEPTAVPRGVVATIERVS
ncbi:hypothetical protein [Nocardia concava]|uniref:hypothetical protein n=1 Tax=Nocardia concava TaxID=257281 RepID=UPI0005946F7E|nr:hypothetical protein [Nocardia concava]